MEYMYASYSFRSFYGYTTNSTCFSKARDKIYCHQNHLFHLFFSVWKQCLTMQPRLVLSSPSYQSLKDWVYLPDSSCLILEKELKDWIHTALPIVWCLTFDVFFSVLDLWVVFLSYMHFFIYKNLNFFHKPIL